MKHTISFLDNRIFLMIQCGINSIEHGKFDSWTLLEAQFKCISVLSRIKLP